MTAVPARPAEYIEIDDPVYGRYAMSWYCTRFLRELGADLARPDGEVPGCPHCDSDEFLACCEWGDVVDEAGAPLRPGSFAHAVFGNPRACRRTHVGVSTVDIAGNMHLGAGSPTGGQFAGRANSSPEGSLTEGIPSALCSMHGGGWGHDPGCTNCADEHGRPLTYPFPLLRGGILAHEVDLNLHWVENPEGPSIVNPSGGVWHLVAHPLRFDDAGRASATTSAQLFNVQVGTPSKDLVSGGDDWWSMDTAPAWVRDYAILCLRELSPAEQAMDAGIAAAERTHRERLARTGQQPTRAAND